MTAINYGVTALGEHFHALYGFRSQLCTRPAGERRYILTHPLVWQCRNGERIVVPVGFLTDLISWPWWARWAARLGRRAKRAAVLHDWEYHRRSGRKASDKLFLEAMKFDGVPRWVRRLMFRAVRIGGASRYPGSE